MSNEYKDYKLELLRSVLVGWKYIPGEHISEDKFEKGDSVVSIETAWEIFQAGKEEGYNIILDDLEQWMKYQREYDDDNERRK